VTGDNDAELHRILRERARAMAAPPPAEASAHFVDLVVFRIAERRFAIDAVEAREAIALTAVTALPGVPSFYRGLISHQGTLYPLVDIRPLINGAFTLEAAPVQAILIASEDATIAICADVVESLVRIDAATIAEARPADDASALTLIRGVTSDGIMVLNVPRLLADARLVVDEGRAISDQRIKGTT
jgi:purine-binding chemotaxis protein CheW